MSEDNLYEEDIVVAFRPSYSATWLNCEAALLDGLSYPDSSGPEAAIGTVFHDIMQEWLTKGKKPYYRLGQIAEIWKQDADREKDEPFRVTIDEDMFHYGRKSLLYAKKVLAKHHENENEIRLVERRVDISHITPIPNQGGTLDLGYLSPGRADCLDWKYGIGVKVFAEWNTQELLYLSGVFQEFDHIYNFKVFGLHIVQPRLWHYDYFEITREQLIDWMEWAKKRAKRAWRKKNRTYTVGVKQCTWCRRRHDCRAKLAALEALVDETFDAIEEPITEKAAKAVEVFPPPRAMATTVTRLSTDELAQIYRYRKLFENWFKQIGETLLARGLEGEKTGDFYVTDGRKFSHWRSQKAILEKLKALGIDEEDLWVKKLKSPNQMKPVLRAMGFNVKQTEKYLAVNTDKIPGKPTLTHKSDGRPEIDTYEDVFE